MCSQVMTHNQPFREIKHTTEVVIRTSQGIHPARPVDPRAAERGLDDNLWDLLVRCWDQAPSKRPQIHEVLQILEN
jgi:hypothetical protein